MEGINMANDEALKLKKEIEKLNKKIITLQFAKACSERRLELICIHDDLDWKYEFSGGGYLERSEYISKLVCNVCGKVCKEVRKSGGFF
jgi:hypothetical protein